MSVEYSPAPEVEEIAIAADEWKELSKAQRIALVDHELAHFDYDDDKDQLTIKGHDVEEFRSVIERHGLWKKDVEFFVQAALPFAK